MKIISWNVNSVRARLDNITNYIKEDKPDIFFSKKLKLKMKIFHMRVLKKIGYDSHIFGQKSYNGVAIISNLPIKKITKDFIKDEKKQARIINGEVQLKKKKIELVNIYVPNGNPIDTEKYEYKKNWLKNLL